MSVSVGKLAPDFSVQAYNRTEDGSEKQFTNVSLSDFQGRWVCLYFYPLDFTFVCPTEIVAFNQAFSEFTSRNCALLTASTDSVYSHKGWCDNHPDLAHMKHLMLADPNHKLSRDYGVLVEEEGIALRGT